MPLLMAQMTARVRTPSATALSATGCRWRPPAAFVVLAGGCLALVLGVGSAVAATIEVNSSDDNTTSGDGLVTLREAIGAANADSVTDLGDTGSGADTIVFDGSLAGGTIDLQIVGDSSFGPSALIITTDVTIDGSGAPFLTISRDAGLARLRHFLVSSSGSLTLENITLADGVAVGFDGGATHRGGTGGGSGGLGGAIFNQGDLTIVQSTLAGSSATGGDGGPQSSIFDTFPRGGSGGGGLHGAGSAPTGADPFDTGGSGGAGNGGNGGNGGDGSTAGSGGGFGGGGGGGGGNANSPAPGGGAGGFGAGGGGGGGGQTGQPAGSGGGGGFGGGNGGNGTSSSSITAPGGGGGGGAGMGGAVFNHGGTVTVTNSTFSANGAFGGGGGRNGGSGEGLGGAIFNRNGDLDVLSTTFTGNTAAHGGGGIFNLGDGGAAAAQIDGTILANSTGSNDFESTTNGGGSASAIGGDNLIESQSGFTGTVVSTADPALGGLMDNGGATKTHAPAAASPVIDSATTIAAPSVDQRGTLRPQGADDDIGAVELVLNHPPVAQCRDVTVEADDACVAAASIDDGSFDPDGDPVVITQAPPGPYPLGDTVVTLTIEDDLGESDTCQATVTVIDVTAPVLSGVPADITEECTGPLGTPVSIPLPTATDNCDGAVPVSSDAPALFPLGTTTVTFTAVDLAGNTATATVDVTIVDTIPPVITVATEPIVLWPPNHGYETISVGDFVTAVDDICDGELAISGVVISQVTSDEPEDVGGGGDGHTLDDMVIAAGCGSVDLRSERQGGGNGRVYTLAVEASDASGNVGSTSFQVHVPHSKKSTAVDDGSAYAVDGTCEADPPGSLLYSDGLESGDTAFWTSVN